VRTFIALIATAAALLLLGGAVLVLDTIEGEGQKADLEALKASHRSLVDCVKTNGVPIYWDPRSTNWIYLEWAK
jgi:hypothetical protein